MTQSLKEYLLEMLKVVVCTAVVCYIINTFFFGLFATSGVSMEPTIHEGDIYIVQKSFYSVSYGDIIVFRPDKSIPAWVLVKRVIGLPGDVIEIRVDEQKVYRNGEALDEPYITQDPFDAIDITGPVTVQEGHYFVLGDNRAHSFDSRASNVGQVAFDSIIGKCSICAWHNKD